MDTRAVVDFETEGLGHRGQCFERMFWVLGASINGFRFCRPVLSIDGTHLFGNYLGCLLMATGMDANKQIFPVTFAIVEKEIASSWEWFLARLKVNVTQERPICIVIDRWSGHVRVINNIYPPEEGHVYRYCIRHVKSNLHKKYNNKAHGKFFWTAATQRRREALDDRLMQLDIMKPGAVEYLDTQVGDKRLWALSHDDGRRCGIITTNHSECFNGVLKGACGLPIRALVAQICTRLNTYFFARRVEADECDTRFPFKIEKLLHSRQRASRNMNAVQHSLEVFRVTYYNAHCNETEVCEVNLPQTSLDPATCLCGFPYLEGLPCSHVMAACRQVNRRYDDLCAAFYSVHAYRNTYTHVLPVIADICYWSDVIGPKMLPPRGDRRQAGRPKTRRNRTEMDPEGRRSNRRSFCNEHGHQRRTCPHYAEARTRNA